MNRIRRVAHLSILAVCSAVISCSSDATPTELQQAVDKVVVSLGLSTLTVGQTVQAGAIAQTAAGGALSSVTLAWSSSNPAVATVTPSGLVTAVAPGTSTITASADGKSASVNVTVMSAPAPVFNVAVALSAPTVQVGQSATATATLRDANNNILTDRTVTWTSSNPAVATVDSSGKITGLAAGTTDILATSEGISGDATLTVLGVGVVPVASVSVSLGTSTLSPGGSTTATATLRDAAGNVLTGRSVAWSSSDASIARVDASGTVTGVTPGAVSITATSEGASGSAAVTVRAVVATVSVAFARNPVGVGSTTTATATARDESNNVLTGRIVAWTSGNSSVATVSAAGIVTGIAAGTTIITGTVEGIPGSATITVQVAAASVTVSLGASSVLAGAATTATAVVRDAGGTALNRTVSWSSSNPSVATVGSDGTVRGVAAGSVNIVGTVDNAFGSAALTVTGSGGSTATQLSITTQPAGAVSGVNLATQPVVQVRDAANALVTTSSAQVTAQIASGSGTLVGTTTVSAVNGVATFTDLRINGSGAHTLVFTSTALTPATSASFTVTQNAASLAIQRQPGGAASGAPFGSQPVVLILDNAGLVVANSTIQVLASIATGTGTLAGTTVVNAVAGVATYTNLQITGTGTFTLKFQTQTPAMQVLSNQVTVGASGGTATQLAITTQPSGAVTGSPLVTQPTVRILDNTGSVVTTSTLAVTVTRTTGTAVLTGTTTVNAVAGVATFTNLRLDGTGTAGLTFSTTNPNLQIASAQFNVAIGPPAQLIIVTQPNGANTGVAFTTQPVVRVADVAGSTVTSYTSAVVAALAAGSSGPLAGTTSVNAVAGVATFTNLQINASGTNTLKFTSGALPAVTSGAIIVGTPGGLAGVIADANGPVGGGTVELLSGATVVQSATVAANGSYAMTSVASGTYSARLQPPLSHSMGASEPAARTVTINANATTTQNFTVQPAVWWDDFQSYGSSSDLTAGCGASTPPAGSFFAGTGHVLSCSSTSQISLDPTGGPGGTKAMRYSWPGETRPAGMTMDDWCKNNEETVRVSPFWTGASQQSFDTLWVRFSTKESAGFVNGATSCMANYATSYKWFLADIGSGSDPNGRIGTYLFAGNSIYTDMYDQSGADLRATQSSSLPSVTYPGQYHTWHIQMFNFGTNSATYRVYLDGVQLTQIVGPFYPGQVAASVSRLTQLDVGANINNRPELPQSRWWREIGIYHTRPSMLPISP